jgi:hypothetical protein
MQKSSPHLSRNSECDDLAQARIVQPKKSRDLTGVDIAASFWHHANSTLRIWRLEGADVVHKGWLGGDLKVADHAVTLRISTLLQIRLIQN